MSEYSYFPGCSATSTGIAYTMSYKRVADALGITLNEISDWNCCGASAGHSESHDMADALSARSLALSEEQYGDMPVLAPCAGCFLHLKSAVAHAREDEATRERIEGYIRRPWAAKADVVNGLAPFEGAETREAIAKGSQGDSRGITDMKVACYYGCALLRPTQVCEPGDEEHPQAMEEILRAAGAEPIEWGFANECCGASAQVAVPKAGRTMVRRILENAAANGADAVACACPLCMLNLDMRESEVNAARRAEGLAPLNLPIYYFTELVGAAMGFDLKELGIDRHFHEAETAVVHALAATPAPVVDPEAEKAARIAAAKKAAAARKAKKAKEAAEAAKQAQSATDDQASTQSEPAPAPEHAPAAESAEPESAKPEPEAATPSAASEGKGATNE